MLEVHVQTDAMHGAATLLDRSARDQTFADLGRFLGSIALYVGPDTPFGPSLDIGVLRM